jgi:heme A synthase
MRQQRFAKFAWGVLAYTVAVILWGAYVRITFSGDGCGEHWPLCRGEVIPTAASVKTLIEFSHRGSSGLLGVLVLMLVVWAFRAYPKGSIVRVAAAVSFLFIVIESALGAGLVKFGLVNKDDSVNRAIVMSLHLVNTLMLVAATALTAWWASGGKPVRLRDQRGRALVLAGGIAATVVLGVSGAITALGDTLFPAASLAQGMQQDLSSTAHFLIRLRIFHPVIALVTSAYIIVFVALPRLRAEDRETSGLSRLLIGLVIAQNVLGALNLYLLAPMWAQIVHLLAADIVWIVLVLFSASTLGIQEAQPHTGKLQGISYRLEQGKWGRSPIS